MFWSDALNFQGEIHVFLPNKISFFAQNENLKARF